MVREFVVMNEQGIHARPATSLVQKANEFKSDIKITYDGNTTDLKSIMGVLSLGVVRGGTVSIRVQGIDEAQAMNALKDFFMQLNLK